MAAEKLTKGRFVQIIIMLTLLITAFIWRTYNNEVAKNVACKQNEDCVFYVNNLLFTAKFSKGVITLKSEKNDWDIEPVSEQVQLEKVGDLWIITRSNPNLLVSIEVSSNDEKPQLIHLKSMSNGF
ncbi:hypothetical protein [Vibrio atypicus]|uniref:hypothetical protein n=1 Tax=Vibrio atypicus TaxID=558271 RepID=UPI00135A4265|nr:hypothetical protein [Vibrio atypicus]